MLIPETMQINMTYSLILLLDINPLIMMTMKYPAKIGAEILPAVMVPTVTTSQSVKRSRVPASLKFEKRTRVMIPMQMGITEIARISVRLTRAGETHGMTMTKSKETRTTPAATRYTNCPLIFNSSFSNLGGEKRSLITAMFVRVSSIAFLNSAA